MRTPPLLLAASILLLHGAPVAADPPRQGPPSRFEALAAIVAAGSVPLARGEACRDVIGEPVARPTLGDWIAYNLSLFDGPSTIAVECREPDAGRRFTCDVSFRTDQGSESPWSWGVRAVFVRRGGKVRMQGRFTCIGAG